MKISKRKKEKHQNSEMPVRAVSEPHVALTLLLDVSISMRGKSIKLLNDAVNKMIGDLKKDERLRNIIDLSLLTFGEADRNNLYQGFRPIADCDLVTFGADDEGTYIASALEQAIDSTKDRVSLYNAGGGAYKPWIVVVTDGEFFDSDKRLSQVGEQIKQMEQKGSLHFFVLGVDGFDRRQIELLTSKLERIFAAKNVDFAEFFDLIGKSMIAVSSPSYMDGLELPIEVFGV